MGNEMNRWFAKVVKYWDDFTSGGDGSTVLKQNGKGIKTISEKPDGDGEEGGDAEVTGDSKNFFKNDIKRRIKRNDENNWNNCYRFLFFAMYNLFKRKISTILT